MKPLNVAAAFIIAFTCTVNVSKAQFSYSNIPTTFMDAGEFKAGHVNTHYGDLEGNPYMFEAWLPGSARLSDGKTYTELLLMYDEVEGHPIFKNHPAEAMKVFTPRAVEFQFTGLNKDGSLYKAHFKSGYAPVDGLDNETYYEVLEAGKMTLLKRTTKTIVKHQTYGDNTMTSTVETTDNYYLAIDNKPAKIKNNNKAVLAAMGDKSSLVKSYIDSKNLNVKNDNDFIAVVKYYNTL